MITPKWVTTRCQPIAIENVLTYLVGVLSAPESIGAVFDIGGSQTLCYREIMCIMAEELGLPRRRILGVPVLTPRLSSYWIHLVTPLSNKIARPLAEGLKNEVVCREDRITRIVPQKLMDVREAIHSALSQVEQHLVETNWATAGPMPGDPAWSGGTVFRDEREVAINAPARAAFGRFAAWVDGVGGMPTGFGSFADGSIGSLGDRGSAAVEGIRNRCDTGTLSISGESLAWTRIARSPSEPRCVCPGKRCSIFESRSMARSVARCVKRRCSSLGVCSD